MISIVIFIHFINIFYIRYNKYRRARRLWPSIFQYGNIKSFHAVIVIYLYDIVIVAAREVSSNIKDNTI